MAIFSRKAAIAIPAGQVVMGADADVTHIFVLGVDTSADTSQIHKFDKQGALVESISVSHDDDNIGLTIVGNGFAFFSKDISGNKINIVSADGASVSSITFSGQSEIQRIGYFPVSNNYVIFWEFLNSLRARTVSPAGVLGTLTRLPSTLLRTGGAVGQSEDGFLVSARDGVIGYWFDNSFASTGETQDFDNLDTGDTIRGSAISDSQVIGISNNALYFYGDEPSPPVIVGKTRQVFVSHSHGVRLDLASDGTFSLKSNNILALLQTATELVDIAGADTLQTQFQRVVIIPYWTEPSAVVGDKLFLHAGDDSDMATDLPSDGVYSVIGFDVVGENYRQSIICELMV